MEEVIHFQSSCETLNIVTKHLKTYQNICTLSANFVRIALSRLFGISQSFSAKVHLYRWWRGVQVKRWTSEEVMWTPPGNPQTLSMAQGNTVGKFIRRCTWKEMPCEMFSSTREMHCHWWGRCQDGCDQWPQNVQSPGHGEALGRVQEPPLKFHSTDFSGTTVSGTLYTVWRIQLGLGREKNPEGETQESPVHKILIFFCPCDFKIWNNLQSWKGTTCNKKNRKKLTFLWAQEILYLSEDNICDPQINWMWASFREGNISNDAFFMTINYLFQTKKENISIFTDFENMANGKFSWTSFLPQEICSHKDQFSNRKHNTTS